MCPEDFIHLAVAEEVSTMEGFSSLALNKDRLLARTCVVCMGILFQTLIPSLMFSLLPPRKIIKVFLSSVKKLIQSGKFFLYFQPLI